LLVVGSARCPSLPCTATAYQRGSRAMAMAARLGFMPGPRPGLLSLSLYPPAVNRGTGCAIASITRADVRRRA
jgi:hypothetical protein